MIANKNHPPDVRWHPPTDKIADASFHAKQDAMSAQFVPTIPAFLVTWEGEEHRVAWSDRNQCLWVMTTDPDYVVKNRVSLVQLGYQVRNKTIEMRDLDRVDKVQEGTKLIKLDPAGKKAAALKSLTSAAAFAMNSGATFAEVRQAIQLALGLDD